ncbi:tetraacyldisaccharide 4'-kinase [Candidatus Pelagibacter communis]|uniref:tetraacyldisaccharide 4'-kinase n=1 Tax=Pelagibacter ubique TaxID=198252 RepID=UPI00094D992F|nr:tetraacyldisaccharide 4'-kinase [Candidatus Pelagibacter ubique]
MKINKPKFWDQKKSFYSIILFPFTVLVKLVIFFKKKFIKSKKFNIPVICIGNIYLGGTGKTPTAILIANELVKIGKKPSIIRKFYLDQEDEYELIRKYHKDLHVNLKRSEAILEAENKSYDSVILDDGFQDYTIKKNFNIICFNQNQLIGNGMVIPSGPLRESLDALKDSQVVIINGKKNLEFEQKILQYNKNLYIFYSNYYSLNSNEFKKKKLLALAGIANPKNFFDLLLKEGLDIEKKIIFPDHYQFKRSEIVNIVKYANERNLQIVMTEKDYFKVKKFNYNEIKYLKIILKIDNYEKLIKLISDKYD